VGGEIFDGVRKIYKIRIYNGTRDDERSNFGVEIVRRSLYDSRANINKTSRGEMDKLTDKKAGR